MKKNSVKNIRINESVKEELSNIIRNEVKDPRIAPVVSVTEAIVATDLKNCKVMISVLGDEKAKEDTMEGLKSSSGFIRHMLAVNLNLRNTPELHFKLDESIEYGVEMSKRIDEVMEQDRRGKHAEEN
ncbi:30S ribosome-binding factor RbfA [Bilifractor sp. HCP3S3_D3]|uniref:30S ribosome-binding factor RbfA n=1 Tax=Bilifractor sp. HCP3S3_D3 TaxID=3438907 RepID=UPI002A8AAA87|nr:30S ribosome-binding factor RbfA [Eubacterium sp.]MDY5113501.1 30S ribosome-binding factor RbfA [Bilifractor sp.]